MTLFQVDEVTTSHTDHVEDHAGMFLGRYYGDTSELRLVMEFNGSKWNGMLF